MNLKQWYESIQPLCEHDADDLELLGASSNKDGVVKVALKCSICEAEVFSISRKRD